MSAKNLLMNAVYAFVEFLLLFFSLAKVTRGFKLTLLFAQQLLSKPVLWQRTTADFTISASLMDRDGRLKPTHDWHLSTEVSPFGHLIA